MNLCKKEQIIIKHCSTRPYYKEGKGIYVPRANIFLLKNKYLFKVRTVVENN